MSIHSLTHGFIIQEVITKSPHRANTGLGTGGPAVQKTSPQAPGWADASAACSSQPVASSDFSPAVVAGDATSLFTVSTWCVQQVPVHLPPQGLPDVVGALSAHTSLQCGACVKVSLDVF